MIKNIKERFESFKSEKELFDAEVTRICDKYFSLENIVSIDYVDEDALIEHNTNDVFADSKFFRIPYTLLFQEEDDLEKIKELVDYENLSTIDKFNLNFGKKS